MMCSSSSTQLFHASCTRRIYGRRRLAAVLVGAVIILAAIVISGSLLASDATQVDFTNSLLPPSWDHPFGTDWMGRDMLARTLAGLATSILIGLASAVISSLLAVILAGIAALGGPRADAVVGWLVDVVMGLPHIVLLVLVSYAVGRGAWGVLLGVSLTHWPSLTRVLRAEIVQLRAQPFMACSRALGVGPLKMAYTHVLPAVFSQYVIGLVLLFPHAILHEASITFLGFGLSPDKPAIGVILSEAMTYLTGGSWWLAVLPGAGLLLVVLLFDRIGSLLRQLLSPQGVQL